MDILCFASADYEEPNWVNAQHLMTRLSATHRVLYVNSLGLTAALYLGDDVTDEDVFRLHQPDLLTIRVGRDDASQARLYLRAPSELPRLIDELIGVLGAHGRTG